MYFYIDESGNTGGNLFDVAQPVLSYGLLSCDTNVDVRAQDSHRRMLGRLGVTELHANQLGEDGLSEIADLLLDAYQKLRFTFDYYFIVKRDYALAQFFDHTFDNVLNPAVPWMWYQTPLRFVLLLKLNEVMDDRMLEMAWRAASTTNRDESLEILGRLMPDLLTKIGEMPLDRRSLEIFRDTFQWAGEFPEHLTFHASTKWHARYMSPNVIGFQFVLSAIARRLVAKSRKQPRSIIVDRQEQYNALQRDLQEHYRRISAAIIREPFPVRSYLDRDLNDEYRNMPARAFDVSSSASSIGLQLTDVFLWLFNRLIRTGQTRIELTPLMQVLMRRSMTDGISTDGFWDRWQNYEARLPPLEAVDAEAARSLLALQEGRRTDAVKAHRRGQGGGG